MKADDRVEAIGLVGAAHLNGCHGVVVQGADAKTGRVGVQFDGVEGVKRIKPQNLVSSAPPPAAARRPPPSTKAAGKVGRNDKCPCGSGRKYKKCCEGKMGADDRQGGSDGGTPMVDDAASLIFAGDASAVRRLIDAGLNVNAM